MFISCATAPKRKTATVSPGQIWDTQHGAWITRDQVMQRLVAGDFVLLGEKHDSPGHHRLQAEVIRNLAAHGRARAVAFEMLTADKQPALYAYRQTSPTNAWGLGAALKWEKSGWPQWSFYYPVFAEVISAGAMIVAADVTHSTLMKIHMNGLQSIDPHFAKAAGLDRPLPGNGQKVLEEDIQSSHCGMAPPDHIARMVDVQRLRDATLASNLLGAGAPAVLIAGAGHARKDIAVPYYLGNLEPGAKIVSLAFIEEDEVPDDPRFFTQAPFDYLWITEKTSEGGDPCEKFKPELEKLHKATHK